MFVTQMNTLSLGFEKYRQPSKYSDFFRTQKLEMSITVNSPWQETEERVQSDFKIHLRAPRDLFIRLTQNNHSISTYVKKERMRPLSFFLILKTRTWYTANYMHHHTWGRGTAEGTRGTTPRWMRTEPFLQNVTPDFGLGVKKILFISCLDTYLPTYLIYLKNRKITRFHRWIRNDFATRFCAKKIAKRIEKQMIACYLIIQKQESREKILFFMLCVPQKLSFGNHWMFGII